MELCEGMTKTNEMGVDENFFNRQLFVLGTAAMQDLSESSVLLCGLGGLGIEIAKNLTLMGIKHIAIYDNKMVSVLDLGQNFFLNSEDVDQKKNRAEASCIHLQELNPYVTVEVLANEMPEFEFITSQLPKYQCIILTDVLDLDFAVKVNAACRNSTPPVKFIWTGVVGIACWTFCDFGDDFFTIDPDGEEPKDIVIGSIIKGSPLVVSTVDDEKHGLNTGDHVIFKDVVDMDYINGGTFPISVLSPTSFSVEAGSYSEGTYRGGGFFRNVKQPVAINFDSLETQLKQPKFETVDFSKELGPQTMHLALLALHYYIRDYGELPNIRSIDDAKRFLKLGYGVGLQFLDTAVKLDYSLLEQVSYTARGYLCPLSAFLGGIVSQEVVKSITRKFMPLQQWMFVDAREVTESKEDLPLHLFTNRGDRYDALRACVGQNTLDLLSDANLFMVGCGAIGCELLKNYALLGVGTHNGKITTTDNDLIEKSNLCRQFLFRMQHIRQPKSVIAARATHQINNDVNIEVHQNKVWKETENIYSNAFFESQHIVVNALDNVETRRYMDRRCVQASRPLLESGTMGCKGHVQVILPHCTETYASQNDPPEIEYPYCSIRTFPSCLEHTVQWAREKFENFFYSKPLVVQKFQQNNHSLDEIINELADGFYFDNATVVAKSLEDRPHNYAQCIAIARLKFEKYFNFKAKQIMHIFPEDTLLKDGTPFWQSPKRPPKPIEFDLNNDLHLSFISSMAQILSSIWKITISPEELELPFLTATLQAVDVPEFVPNNSKVIETDESATQPSNTPCKDIDVQKFIIILKKENDSLLPSATVCPQPFEKDDDINVNFVYAASGLRSIMYGLEPGMKLKVQRIAGRIIPAIASTTAAVAGLVSLELLKVVKGLKERSVYKNSFLNLALPLVVMSEPAPPKVQFLGPHLNFTEWDRWHIEGRPEMIFEEFLEVLKAKCGLNPNMVLEGSKIIWMPLLPGHANRTSQLMLSLLNPNEFQEYHDLSVTYDGESDDLMGPSVRYYFDKSP